MNNWKNYTVNIGYIKEKTSTTVKFESNKQLDIVTVKPGCGSCTKFLDYKDNILSIKYDAPSHPIHLGNNNAVINKTVDIHYSDGTFETLKFVGFLTKK